MGLIRLFLAITVVVTHSAPLFGLQLAGGQTAVESFFVISGFYMQMVLSKKYIPSAAPTWRTFMAARLGRLMPLYWVILALSLAASLVGFNSVFDGQETRGADFTGLTPATIAVLVLSQLLLVCQDVLMFMAVNPEGGLYFTPNFHDAAIPAYTFLLIGQAWTVSLELVFYAVAPWLARARTTMLFSLAFLSVSIRILLMSAGHYQDPWSYRFFPSELLFFLAGMLAFRYRHVLVKRAPDWRLCLAGMVVLWALFPLIASRLPGGYLMLPWALSLLLALMVPTFFEHTKRSSLDRWLGEFSYPVYLSHVLVLSLLHVFWPGYPGWAGVLLALVLGYILVLVDRPIENRRKEFVASQTGRVTL